MKEGRGFPKIDMIKTSNPIIEENFTSRHLKINGPIIQRNHVTCLWLHNSALITPPTLLASIFVVEKSLI